MRMLRSACKLNPTCVPIVAQMGMIKLHSQSCSQTAVGSLGTETALRLPVIRSYWKCMK